MGNKETPSTDRMAKDLYERFWEEIQLPLTTSINSFKSISNTSINETKMKWRQKYQLKIDVLSLLLMLIQI